MVRPLRLEFPGAVYHAFSRGNRSEPIFLDEKDLIRFLALLSEVCERFNWLIHAYCLMTNHYHLMVETPDANLSRGMRHLNGVYTQRFNRRHERVGHVFQGRFKSPLVQKESYLAELSRYIVLNPLRAGLVRSAADWRWSSFRATAGYIAAPGWLKTDWLLAQFAPERTRAITAYKRFVAAGKHAGDPMEHADSRLILGDADFENRIRELKAGSKPLELEIDRNHRRTLALPLAEYAARYTKRDEAMAKAYYSGAYTMREIAAHFSVHYMTVSRAVRKSRGQV